MKRFLIPCLIACVLLALVSTAEARVFGSRRPSVTVSADKTTIAPGETVRVSWVGVNATSATFDTELVYYTYSDPVRVPVVGWMNVRPTETTTYYVIVRYRKKDLNGNFRPDGWRCSSYGSVTVEVKP